MFYAKVQGCGWLQFFSAESWRRIERRFTMEAELYIALEQEQFEVFYQPQVKLPSNRICGAEALLRWR
jgi:sensor c-di-GMP phosphodiesterase-like protein